MHYPTDADGEIPRDDRSEAKYLDDTEALARGWSTHDETIVAFLGETVIGFVSNEWGAVGAWVSERLSAMRYLYCARSAAFAGKAAGQTGQMTVAGEALARAVHRSLVRDAAAAQAVCTPCSGEPDRASRMI